MQLCCFGQGTYNATRKNKYLDLSSVQQAESHSIREGGSSTLSFKLFLVFLRMPGTPIFKMKMAYDQNVEQLKVLCTKKPHFYLESGRLHWKISNTEIQCTSYLLHFLLRILAVAAAGEENWRQQF